MVKSQITKAIDQVVSAGIHPVLKERGFKKQGRTFHKRVGDLYHVIRVQGSQFNEFDSGQFTINLGIASPEIAALWRGGRVAKNPAGHRNTLLSERVGHLLPIKKDHWWTVGPDTDLGELTQEISATLTKHALKFFETPAFQSTQALLEALERGVLQMSLFGAPTIQAEIRAVLLHSVGRVDEAKAILAGQITAKEHKLGLERYVNRIKDLGARLGFTI